MQFLKKDLRHLITNYICRIFGSFATGLSLPTSDVDVVVFVKGIQKETKRREEVQRKYGDKADEIHKQAAIHHLRALEKAVRKFEMAKSIMSIEGVSG